MKEWFPNQDAPDRQYRPSATEYIYMPFDDDNQFPSALQGHLFACLLNDAIAFQTCRPILSTDYFDDPWVKAVKYAIEYFDDTGKPVPIALVQAKTNTTLTLVPHEAFCETDWLVQQIEAFCRRRAVDNIIMRGFDLDGAEIANLMNDAVAISISQREKFQDISLRELLAVAMPDWLIPGVIYERSVAMVYGPPDSFKSFVILHLASLLAHGMRWNGYDLKARPVLYVAGEGAPMFGRRRKAWFLHHDLPLDDDNLTVIAEPVMLLDPADVRLFINAQKRKGWHGGLVIIDTVSKCVPGANESDVEVMTQVIASADLIAKELDCAVILVHHTGWDSAHARGSSASLGNCEVMARIDRKGDHRAMLAVEKQKDGARQSFDLLLHQVKLGVLDRNGEEITSLCATEATQDDKVEHDAITAMSDRMAIASAMTQDDMKQSDVIALLMDVCRIRERQARTRVIQAIPDEWTKTRCGTGFVELRRVEVTRSNVRIERRVAI
jgi:hypothetical protein